MEVDEIQTQSSKFSRINSNGKIGSSKVGNRPPDNSTHNHHHQYPNESDNEREQMCSALVATGTGATTGPTLTSGSASALLAVGEVGGAGSRLRSWQHSSRIIRVSRASGGKDRHSKVWTAKGPRDRRVRLSVTTAIQFYDLQDRLGFDQPSKAVEWLIKAAADSIAELPALNETFPETPRHLYDVKRGAGPVGIDNQGLLGNSSFEVHLDGEDPSLAQNQTQTQPGSNLSKSSNCSSTSETSKGSGGLSLSRTESRVKARERARVRTAKEKDKETDSTSARVVRSQPNVNRQALSHQTTSSFTQLLTSGIGLVSDDQNNSSSGIVASTSPQAREQQQQWCSPMEYFSSMGLMGPTSAALSRANQSHNHSTTGFIQLGNSNPQAMTISPLMSLGGESSHPSELHHQHYPYGLSDHHLVVPTVPSSTGLSAGSSSGHYNLNFSISSSNPPGLAGFSNSTNNRGTLQSNSSQSHFMPHLQRFSSGSSSAVDVSTQLPFFLGATAVDNHQHQPFPGGFQLCYGDNGDRHSDHRGKEKN